MSPCRIENKKIFRKLCSDNAKDAIKGLSKFIENKENVRVKIADPRSLLYYSCGYAKWCLLLEATCDKEKPPNIPENLLITLAAILFPVQRRSWRPSKNIRPVPLNRL